MIGSRIGGQETTNHASLYQSLCLIGVKRLNLNQLGLEIGCTNVCSRTHRIFLEVDPKVQLFVDVLEELVDFFQKAVEVLL